MEGHPEENECIDSHWMKYEDSTCTFDMLESQKAFTVERHALKITQPLEELVSDGSLRIACPASQGRRFGRIDFSKGFSDWWFLSHVDIKIPSEHTQDGKRYSAEAQLAHFYSIPGEVAGVDNEVRVSCPCNCFAPSRLIDGLNKKDGYRLHLYASL